MLGGLGHCIRWVPKAHNRRIRLPKATWQELDREALEFLVWGMQYHTLSADHIVWSRSMLQANLDMTNKVVKFSAFSNFDSAFLLAQQSDDQRALETFHNALPIQELQRDFERWRRHFKVVDGGFNFAEDAARQLASYPAVLHWLETGVLPGVQANEDLGGYSLDEFRRFFAALFMNCNFWTWVEDGFDELFGAEHDFGTSMLTLPHSAMMQYLQHMSGLRIEAVKALVRALTYDASNFHASLTNQPFVQSSDKRLFLLPRLIAHVNPGRMLVGAMNKGVGRQAYDKLIEPLSRVALAEIASVFQGLGLEVWQEKKIPSNHGKFITPDLIVLDRAKGELLVADYKHSLSPVGPSEVVYKLVELEKGLKQVRGYLSVMRTPANWPAEIQSLEINKIMGLLIFGYPMVIPMRVDPEIVVVNKFSLYEQLTPQLFTTLSSLIGWAKTRPELPFQPGRLREHEWEVRVSDWTYKRSMHVAE
jgi:hypothetical protein